MSLTKHEINPDGHEIESESSLWAQRFYRPFLKVASDYAIGTVCIGDDYFKFNIGDKVVSITFIVQEIRHKK